jgi:hypothetical protein
MEKKLRRLSDFRFAPIATCCQHGWLPAPRRPRKSKRAHDDGASDTRPSGLIVTQEDCLYLPSF